MVALLAVCACGRLNFEGANDASSAVLTVTSPPDQAEVRATAILTGTCVSGLGVIIAGSGLAQPVLAGCDGAFTETIAFTEGNGAKLVTVTQGAVTLIRTFVRVTSARLRTTAVTTQPSAGSTVDCDLTLTLETRAGDLLFGMIYSDAGVQGSVATPGFTRTALARPAHVAFWKIAGGDEPTSYMFRVVAGVGVADTCESAGVIGAFEGIAPATPLLAESANIDGNDVNVVALGVTAPTSGILVGAWGSNGPATGFTPPAGALEAAQANSPGGFANVLLTYEPVEGGPTGNRTATLQQSRSAAAGLFVLDGQL